MPTDPFVAPDLDDRPRQQQNLPAGIGYPPARSWTADRPGDGVGEEPEGRRLRGSPGPNVGYAYTLAERAAETFHLAPHEHAHDAVCVVAEVAGKRAASYGRAPVMADIKLAMTVLGYDSDVAPAFGQWRARAVHEAGHSYPVRRALVDAVPESLLRSRPSELAAAAAQWRASVAGAA